MKNKFIYILTLLLFSVFLSNAQTKQNWPDELNTAEYAGYLSDLEKQVIHELNKVRSNPERFSEEYIEILMSAYNEKTYTYPGQDPVKSQEGIKPLIECIQVLRNTAPLPILSPANGLAKGAKYLVKDQQYGGTGHIARDGYTPQKRIEKYGEWNICSAEDITYGSFEARQIVIALLIDDGVPDRGHRKNILNPCTRFVGVSYGGHPSYQSMCVIDYAGEYKTK